MHTSSTRAQKPLHMQLPTSISGPPTQRTAGKLFWRSKWFASSSKPHWQIARLAPVSLIWEKKFRHHVNEKWIFFVLWQKGEMHSWVRWVHQNKIKTRKKEIHNCRLPPGPVSKGTCISGNTSFYNYALKTSNSPWTELLQRNKTRGGQPS